MKHVNENPYEFFSTGGWGFLGAPNGEEQESDDSGSESEYEQAPDESDYSEVSASASDFDDGSDASEDEGSGSDFSEGEDWDELERKAARCKWIFAGDQFIFGDLWCFWQRIRRYKRGRRRRVTSWTTPPPVQRRPLQGARVQLNLKQRPTEGLVRSPTGNDRDLLLRFC